MLQSPRRRKLDYSPNDDVIFTIKDLKSDSELPEDLLRPAARRWAQGAGWTLGSYSQPVRCPAAEPTFSCTARCFEHELCHANQGSVFRFEGHIEQKHFYRLLVQKAGDCNGQVRNYRESATSSKELLAVSTEDRRRIHAAADSLLQDYMQATPTAVIQRMGDPPVDAAHARSVLRWRREQHGSCTAAFRASESDFTEEAERWADVDSKPIHLARWTLNLFCWAAVVTPFMLELVRLKQTGRLDGIYLAVGAKRKADQVSGNKPKGSLFCVFWAFPNHRIQHSLRLFLFGTGSKSGFKSQLSQVGGNKPKGSLFCAFGLPIENSILCVYSWSEREANRVSSHKSSRWETQRKLILRFWPSQTTENSILCVYSWSEREANRVSSQVGGNKPKRNLFCVLGLNMKRSEG